MADDSTTGEVILFGGKGTGSHYFNDTWAYTPAANRWAKLHTVGSPHARLGASMAYDSATELNDTWHR